MTEPYVGIDKAAPHIGVSKSSLYHWVAEQKYGIPAYKVGSRLLFKISELEQWMATQRIGPDGNGDHE